ncbi:hypothetical protein O1611_g7156 [Lasiodiplodia mahajangana]|uniref:Uncharacterized protein n=1 Tax=Lasiodiplodia mahajangana TaxID=1108764 RepID=A0ACC2JG65_9PEZI|nr:hypothetical protein O1611_g7156 [Lasiodiplodia mahajangana]
MPLPHTPNTNGNSRSSKSKSHNRQRDRGPNDGADDRHEHFHTLRKLFRSKSSYQPKTEPKRDDNYRPSRRTPQTVNTSQSNHRPDKGYRSKSIHTPVRKADGTRGVFSPAYGHLEHFTQHLRQRNPIVTPRANGKQRSKKGSQVIVQFFNCGNLSIGENFLVAPDLGRLDSAAVAFLGQCQLGDVPDALIPRSPNPAYRGLSLQGSHGGYHLHYPDSSGVKPFRTHISDDWRTVMKLHAHTSPNSVLLVGVGIGAPGRHCL